MFTSIGMNPKRVFGDVSDLPTHLFLNPLKPGDEVDKSLVEGQENIIRSSSIQDRLGEDGSKTIIFEVTGEPWNIPVTDLSDTGNRGVREKLRNPTMWVEPHRILDLHELSVAG